MEFRERLEGQRHIAVNDTCFSTVSSTEKDHRNMKGKMVEMRNDEEGVGGGRRGVGWVGGGGQTDK